MSEGGGPKSIVVAEVDMKEVQIRQAKARLSALMDEANRGEPTVITRRGKPVAILISFAEWQRLTRPSFADFLLSAPFEPGDIPERDRRPVRKIDLG